MPVKDRIRFFGRPMGLLAGVLCVTGCPSRQRPPSAPPKTVSERPAQVHDAVDRSDALVALARAYGYMRYFHPSAEAAQADWPNVLVDGVAQVTEANTYATVSDALQTVFAPYARDVQMWIEPEPAPRPPKPPRTRAGLVYWQHQGYEGTPLSLFRPPYATVRVTPQTRYERRFAEAPDPTRPFEGPLLGPLRVRVPLALSSDHDASLPAPGYSQIDPGDFSQQEVREAIIIDVWNVLRHFYPYQEEVHIPWEQVLRTALHDTIDDKTPEDMIDSIRTLTRALIDGHARVERDGVRGRGWLPARTECVEDQVVITASEDPKLHVGDVIVKIEGEAAFERSERIAERLSGTPRWRSFRACTWDGAQGQARATTQLHIQRGGKTLEVETTFARPRPLPPTRPPAITTLPDGVMYVDLTRTSWTDLQPEIEALADAPGVVFDLRGYPIHNDDLLDHLMNAPEDAQWMHVPRFIAPGGTPVGYADIGWYRRPSTPHIAAPVVFLISPAAISYAESILAYVKTHHLGTLIGSATAGANGDIVRHDSLAGFYVVFSGMRVTRHDGTVFHNEGVTPDLQRAPTLKGIAQGHDEVLDAGLAEVRRAIEAR